MIIALTGQKGGIGKSTTAVSLAVAALFRGKRVLLVDADPQGTVRTWGEVAIESGQRTPTIVAMGTQMHRRGQLDELTSAYDLTLIDCPPRHGEISRSALMVADIAVFPCGPTAADAWALSAALEVFREASDLRASLDAGRNAIDQPGLAAMQGPRPLSGCVLITRKQGRTALAKSARNVLESSGLPVLEAELGFRVAYQEAIAAGKGVTTYAPRDASAKEINQLLDELERFYHGQKASGSFAPQAAVA